MTYTDTSFLFLLLPVSIILYNIMPKKIRGYVLLLMSYIFFYLVSRKLIIFIIFSTGVIWLYSLIIKHIHKKRDAKLEVIVKKKRKKQLKKSIRKYKEYF